MNNLAERIAAMLAAFILGMVVGVHNVEAAEFEGIYAKLGLGYKFSETEDVYNTNNELVFSGGRNPSARIDIYGKWDNGISVGIGHQSNYRDGTPFNDRPEYHKTEIFIDYSRCIIFCK